MASVSKKGVVKAKKKRKGSDYGKGREVETESKDNRKSKKKKDNSSGDNQNETKQPVRNRKTGGNRQVGCDATANRKADGRTKSDKKAGG